LSIDLALKLGLPLFRLDATGLVSVA
jgi:hypothetical protein